MTTHPLLNPALSVLLNESWVSPEESARYVIAFEHRLVTWSDHIKTIDIIEDTKLDASMYERDEESGPLLMCSEPPLAPRGRTSARDLEARPD